MFNFLKRKLDIYDKKESAKKTRYNEYVENIISSPEPTLPEELLASPDFQPTDQNQYKKILNHFYYVFPDLDWWQTFKKLSSEQYEIIYELVFSKESVIVVKGIAGSGKSHIIKFYIDYLKMCQTSHHIEALHFGEKCIGNCHKDYRVLAPTGVAARCVDGATLDMYLGGGVSVNRNVNISIMTKDVKDPEDAYSKISNFLQTDEFLPNCNVSTLIIDECFMVSGNIHLVLLHILRHTPCLKLRYFGDPYQLLPIVANKNWGKNFDQIISRYNWKCMELKKIIRTDNFLLQKIIILLREAIKNNLTVSNFDSFLQETLLKLSILQNKEKFDAINTRKMIVAYTNEMNQKNNDIYLSKLPGQCMTFVMQSEDQNEWYHRTIRKNTILPDHRIMPILNLKLGATVMATRNMNSYKNGMIGTVVEFRDGSIIVNFEGENVDVRMLSYEIHNSYSKKYTIIKQYPLILAYSVTVYKTQGITCKVPIYIMQSKYMDMRSMYVIFSRITHINMLHFSKPFNIENYPKCFSRKKDIFFKKNCQILSITDV